MDISKAYDYIPHELLIAKLEAHSFKRISLKPVYSYLTSQAQRVKIGPSCSSSKHISIGVAQDSVFEPLLFNILLKQPAFLYGIRIGGV